MEERPPERSGTERLGGPAGRAASPSAPGRTLDLASSAAIAATTLVLLTATLGDYGMAWDEGFTVEREERVGEWWAWVAGDRSAAARAWSPPTSNLEPRAAYLRRAGRDAASPWSRESIRFFWPFAREEPSGHPPFYALLGLAGRAAARRWLPPLEPYRFGPAALFALTEGAVYLLIARRYGRIAGLAASLGLLAMPRVFAHAHLASYDVPTLCLWFLAVAAFSRAVESPGGGVARTAVFGLAWGAAAATKLTGWFLPLPLAAWALLHRDGRAARVLFGGLVVAGLVTYALIPPWWGDPIEGVRVFLRSNLGREARSPIPTLFLGRVYPFSLPWYNTLVWTAVTVPPATLALAAGGIGRLVAGRLRDRTGTLLLACWAFLMALRSLPGAPGHDGERQFLPAFAFLACLAGVGAGALRDGLARRLGPRRAAQLAWAIAAVALATAGWSTRSCHPLQLSYYNDLCGGLRGARRAGLEPTYYWDALTPDVRDWLNAQTPPGRSLMFAYPVPTFDYLHHWGLLRPPVRPDRGHPPRWYVVQNRPGILRRYPICALASYLLEHARPAHVKTLASAPDVPLIAIFSIDDALEAERALGRRGPTSPPNARAR